MTRPPVTLEWPAEEVSGVVMPEDRPTVPVPRGETEARMRLASDLRGIAWDVEIAGVSEEFRTELENLVTRWRREDR